MVTKKNRQAESLFVREGTKLSMSFRVLLRELSKVGKGTPSLSMIATSLNQNIETPTSGVYSLAL